ncbi:MAG TPA: glycosyltransferase family 2 protein, partial [Gemmatimonadaceae bacterium]|nr:glycosyltransferase family 2 protein [Gemmatimonadaceae bacterium]
MTIPRVSVVIPTYRRRDALLRLLSGLARQRLPATDFEVIVVVDGSLDGSREAAEALSTPYELRVLWQENLGRSAARNAGLDAARGELVVMLDDDMEPAPDLLVEHLRAHDADDPVAVMGAVPVVLSETTSAPAAYVGSKFNRHMERLARTGAPVTLRDFYGGNLSVRRDVLARVRGFDEGFTRYGNEDLELSLRLAAAGVRIVFAAAAVAFQSYDKDFSGLAADTVSKGRTAVLLARKHPQARQDLKLGSAERDPLVRRTFVGALLAATRITPALSGWIVRGMTALGERRRELALRLYAPVLDYLYWCGVREA